MDSIGKIIEHAENGNRLKISGKTVWAGLGNRSGLHGFATTLIDEKWEKSGPRFERKMSQLPPGTVVELHRFRNITRDRGRWHHVSTVTVGERV